MHYVIDNIHTDLPKVVEDVLNGLNTVRKQQLMLELPEPALLKFTPNAYKQFSLVNPYRKVFPPLQFYEIAWVIAGRNDLFAAKKLTPRLVDFSDDYATWRGGYGPRIHWGNNLRKIVELLYVDQNSRQATLPIYFPVDVGAGQYSKDVPCSLVVSFQLRDKEFQTSFMIRSNDAFWGMTHININLMKVLGYLVKHFSGVSYDVEPTLYYLAVNLHLYKDRHEKRARKMIDYAKSHKDELGDIRPYEWWEPFHRFSSNVMGYSEFISTLRKELSEIDEFILNPNKEFVEKRLPEMKIKEWWFPIVSNFFNVRPLDVGIFSDSDVVRALKYWR